MKLTLLACSVLCGVLSVKAFDLMDIFKEPENNTVINTMGWVGKNLKCWKSTKNITMPQLTECKPGAFCVRKESRGKNWVGYLKKTFKILYCSWPWLTL